MRILCDDIVEYPKMILLAINKHRIVTSVRSFILLQHNAFNAHTKYIQMFDKNRGKGANLK